MTDAPEAPRQEREALDVDALAQIIRIHRGESAGAIGEILAAHFAGYVTPEAHAAALREAWEALRPFADFADPSGRVPPDMPITHGSAMAKRQLTMGHCYAARAALTPPAPKGDDRD